jgi:hypothetical protein
MKQSTAVWVEFTHEERRRSFPNRHVLAQRPILGLHRLDFGNIGARNSLTGTSTISACTTQRRNYFPPAPS